MSHKPSRVTIVLAALGCAGVLAALAYLAIVAPRGVPLLRYYHVNAQFADASQIAELSQVRIAGRQVGQVTGSSYEHGHAVVRMSLYPGEPALRSDSRARIRLNGLLGAKFVELVPGRSGRTLPSDSTLPVSHTSTAVDIPTVLRTFGPATIAHLQTSLRGLGEGFLGRGQGINQMLTVAPAFYGRVGQISKAVVDVPGAAARFIPSAELLAHAYDPVREQLASGFTPEANALNGFNARSSQIDRTLEIAPGALSSLQRGLDASTPLLNETAGLARATAKLTRPAPAALRQTTALLEHAEPALRHSNPAVSELSAAVPNTLGFLSHVDPVIPPAISAMAESIPSLLDLGQHSCDVLSFARNWRSSLGFGVPAGGGPLGAGEAGLGALTSLRVIAVRPLSELYADLPQPTRPHDAYPAPCQANGEHSG